MRYQIDFIDRKNFDNRFIMRWWCDHRFGEASKDWDWDIGAKFKFNNESDIFWFLVVWQ